MPAAPQDPIPASPSHVNEPAATTTAEKLTWGSDQRSPRVLLPQIVRGFAMGSADVVPGVSGGTVALALGIYHRLVAALDRCVDVAASVLRFDGAAVRAALRAVPWLWLIGLGTGILSAVFLLASPLERALAAYPERMAGLFMGLILGATVLCLRQLKHITPAAMALLALSSIVFFVILGLSTATHGEAVDGASAPWWAFFGAGAIAICAMILPGISGSFLLVLMGMYAPVLGAVSNLRLGHLVLFALGCAFGLALASRGLNWLLIHHHDLLLAAMIGLMLGSLRVLWPWPNGLDSTQLALPVAGEAMVPIVLSVVGLVVVLLIDTVARQASARRATE